MNSTDFLFEQELTWEDLGGGVQRQILGYDDKILMARIKFEKGSIGQLHHHFHSQVTYIVSGKFEVELNGNKKMMKGGDAFYVTPDLVHGVRCLEAGEFIDVFTPAREDFLQIKK